MLIFLACSKDKEITPVIDYPTALKDTLNQLSARSDNTFFKLHCESIIEVIEGYDDYTSVELDWIKDAYYSFSTVTPFYSSRDISTYLNRNRSFILSWVSPTDGVVSFAYLTPPSNWNPAAEYPLYVSLHGMWEIPASPIKYLTYPYITNPSQTFAFEDGYLLEPWGRGNWWYQGLSETDIWESIDILEDLVSINQKRKYILGHSMGGYGAWHFGIIAPDIWAAIGLSSSAIWYNQSELTQAAITSVKNTPFYFVCGGFDGNLGDNQLVYQSLEAIGNENLSFVIFNGGHVYLTENIENMYLWLKQFEKE